ncbi:MAG: hypothetical protein ACUVQ0_04775 [Thermoproteota archaeon]
MILLPYPPPVQVCWEAQPQVLLVEELPLRVVAQAAWLLVDGVGSASAGLGGGGG